MTDPDTLLAEYRAGLDAELALLAQLEALAARQQAAARNGDGAALDAIRDGRDRLMAAILGIERDLQPLRRTIAADTERLRHSPAFDAVAALHRQAGDKVAAILTSDRESLAALHDAQEARRLAERAVEQGESTLSAYRRVITPSTPGATLVSRRG